MKQCLMSLLLQHHNKTLATSKIHICNIQTFVRNKIVLSIPGEKFPTDSCNIFMQIKTNLVEFNQMQVKHLIKIGNTQKINR